MSRVARVDDAQTVSINKALRSPNFIQTNRRLRDMGERTCFRLCAASLPLAFYFVYCCGVKRILTTIADLNIISFASLFGAYAKLARHRKVVISI